MTYSIIARDDRTDRHRRRRREQVPGRGRAQHLRQDRRWRNCQPGAVQSLLRPARTGAAGGRRVGGGIALRLLIAADEGRETRQLHCHGPARASSLPTPARYVRLGQGT